MQAKMCASVWMEDSTAQVILVAAVHQGIGEHFVRTTIILVSSSVHLQAHLLHTHSHTILFCSVYVCTYVQLSTVWILLYSFIHFKLFTSSRTPNTWTGCSCLNDGYYNASHCLCQEGYGGPYCEAFDGEGDFLSCCPPACGWCVHLHVLMCMCMYIWSGVCVFKSEHCNALDYYPFL